MHAGSVSVNKLEGVPLEALRSVWTTVRRLVTDPNAFFDELSRDQRTASDVFKEFLWIVALIPPVSAFIGKAIIGIHGYTTPFGRTLLWAVYSYLFSLFGVWLTAKAIEYVSPNFDTPRDFNGAFRLVTYTSAPAFVAGIFQIIPALSLLSVVGLYSLYLLYTYLPRVLEVPEDKAQTFSLVAVVIVVLTWAVVSAVASLLVGGP